MPLWKNTQHSFAAGQLDTHVMGRQDMDKYAHGATLLKNFLVKRQGCISKRRGTDLVADLHGIFGLTEDGNVKPIGKMRLVPVINGDDGRYLILSGGEAFVADRRGLLTNGNQHAIGIDLTGLPGGDGIELPRVSGIYAAPWGDCGLEDWAVPTMVSGDDPKHNEYKPFELLHKGEDGMWTSNWFRKFKRAVQYSEDNDIIRLHCDVIFAEIGDWVLENGSAVNMWFDSSYRCWRCTYANQSYASGSYQPDDDLEWLEDYTESERFQSLGWKAFRIDNYQKQTYIESTDWDFDDGEVRVMTRFTEGSGGWRATGSDEVLSKDGGNANDTTVTFDAGIVTATRTNSSSTEWTYSGEDGNWTCAWAYCQFTPTSSGWAWKLTDGERTFYNRRLGQNATTVTFATRQVVATRKRKRLRIDLYGYKLTVKSSYVPINVNARCDVTVTSMRPGGKIVNMSIGTPCAFQCEGDSTLTTNGEIDWQVYTESYAPLLRMNGSSILTVNGGMFSRSTPGHGSLIAFSSTAHGIFNSGTFESVKKGSRAGAGTQNSIIVSGILTINGGEFFMDAPAGESSYVIDNSSACTVTVNGGQFRTTGCAVFAKANATDDFNIVRGEFSVRETNDDGEGTGGLGSGALVPMAPIVETAVSPLASGNLEDLLEEGSVIDPDSPDEDGFVHVNGPDEGTYGWTGVRYGSSLFRISVPYADDDLADLCIRQSGDTVFIAHRNYPPAKVWFDKNGFAHFDQILFDNTDFFPPEITRCVMVGQDEKETDEWPQEFPRLQTTANLDADLVRHGTQYWNVGGCPNWLTGRNLTGSSYDNSQLAALINFYNECKSAGTVTNAGFSGNKADGTDGSCSYACSYTCTIVRKNYIDGKKTTTVKVLSFTKSVTKEVTTVFSDGLASGSSTNTITTAGKAENSASATSPITTRTVSYVATYVKDGKESRPCDEVAVKYDMPWSNGALVQINLARGSNKTNPEYYNVYKNNGNGYGLIATFSGRRAITGMSGTVDDTSFLVPTSSPFGFVGAVEFEEARRWTSGTVFRLLVDGSQRTLTDHVSQDVSLVMTTSKTSSRVFRMSFGAESQSKRFDTMTLSLDGRMYDPERDECFVIPSVSIVRCTLCYMGIDGNEHTVVKTERPKKKLSGGGTSYVEWPPEWQVMSQTTFDAPNGDKVLALCAGQGENSELFNDTLRVLEFDFSDEYPNMASVKHFDIYFGTDYYTEHFDANAFHQGVIRSIEFSCSHNLTADIEDDYINPDMSVTPPSDQYDPHFFNRDDYPGCVGIYSQRLVFASSRANPSTIWMSRIADLYNFTAHDSIREDDALELTIAATEFPNINHFVMGRDLMLFGEGGEWLISPVSGNTLTYKTASAKLQSMIGSDRRLAPIQVSDEMLFAEHGGTCLRSINYNYTSDSYQSNDLSVIAQSIFRANPIVSMAYKQHPDSIVECVLKDGRVATLVYMKEQDVAAWSVQELGGGWKAREIVTPRCIVDGTTEMMLLVEKGGRYQLWKVRNDDGQPTGASQAVLDAMHVESSSIVAFAGETAVSIGSGKYAVGFPVVSEFVSVRPEPERGQTAQMEIKNATESEVRVIDGSTFSVKPYAIETGWREVSLPVVRSGSGVTLAEKDCKRLMTGTNNRDGRIHIRHAEPWPLTVLSISNTYQVEYENGKGGDE